MPLYLSILKHVNTPTDKWSPKDLENHVGRYDSSRNNLKVEDNFAFDFVELHKF